MNETGENEIWTLGGRKIDFISPTPSMIDMPSMAVSLANMSRFNGYTNGFYSVAQHSVIMSYWVEDLYEGSNMDLAKAAVLHDFGEAWIGEHVTSLKKHLKISHLENKITRMIFEDHDIDPDLWNCAEIKELDMILLNTEIRDLKSGYAPPNPEMCIPEDEVTINPQMPDSAYSNLKMRYNALFPDRQITAAYRNLN